MKQNKKPRTIKVPLVTHCDANGKITHDYKEIPVTVYEQWLKQCYEQSGCF